MWVRLEHGTNLGTTRRIPDNIKAGPPTSMNIEIGHVPSYLNKVYAMRFSEGELPILSAELYGDDPVFAAPKRLTAVRKKQTRSSSRGIEEGPRKRKKTQVVETPENDDETKRARGRPRLDTKDETAADVS